MCTYVCGVRLAVLAALIAAPGCWTATTTRTVSSQSGYARPVSLIGARSSEKVAFRISGEGEGAALAGDATADAGVGGRRMSRGYVGGVLGVQIGKHFEVGLLAGTYLGQVRSSGNPVDLGEPALPVFATESRAIFGPEEWQISIHLRLGRSAVAATWDYETIKRDSESGSESETRTLGHAGDWEFGLNCAAGLSFAWRFHDTLSLIGGFNVDIVPYLERESTETTSEDSDFRVDGTRFPPLRYGAVPVAFIGLEATLHPHVRARVSVTPYVSQPGDSEPAWLLTQGAIELTY